MSLRKPLNPIFFQRLGLNFDFAKFYELDSFKTIKLIDYSRGWIRWSWLSLRHKFWSGSIIWSWAQWQSILRIKWWRRGLSRHAGCRWRNLLANHIRCAFFNNRSSLLNNHLSTVISFGKSIFCFFRMPTP